MDKAQADNCVKEMLAHLTTWAEDNNIQLSHKKCVYDPRAGFADITFTVIGEGGCSAVEHDLKQHASYDFTEIKPEWIGQEITVKGRKAELFGFAAQATKFPYLVRCGNGDVFKVTEATIVRQMSAA